MVMDLVVFNDPAKELDEVVFWVMAPDIEAPVSDSKKVNWVEAPWKSQRPVITSSNDLDAGPLA